MVTIRNARAEDAKIINRLAEAIWWKTYTPIIGEEQVHYMLHLFYNIPKLEEQIKRNEQTYLLLYEDDIPLVFAAFSPRIENPDLYKLHKLYCLEESRGKGYGKMLVDEVENKVLEAGKNVMDLNVNRHNPAVSFYKTLGFEIIYSEDIDIGNGYQMNDYVMRKQLSDAQNHHI